MNRRADNKRPLLKGKDLRAMSDEALKELLRERIEELSTQQHLRSPKGRGYGTGDSPNSGVLRNCRKEIARIKTVLAERART